MINPLLDACSVLLDPLVAALIQWLAATEGSVGQAAADGMVQPDTQDLRSLMQRLCRLLSDSDSAVEQLWQNEGARLRPLLGERWDRIDAALRGFDFDAALQALQDAAQAKGAGS